MGFPLEGVVSAEGHISEFICAICQLLAEYPVLTKCSNEHVFCQSCLDKWFKCKRSCPKCNGDLALPRAVRPLKEASPLAHRVLQRVKVKCPLSEQLGCAWQGDYGGVHAHLTNSEGHTGFDRTPPAASSSKQRQSSSQSSGPATDHHAGGMTWGDVGVQGNGVAPRQADPYHGTPGSGPSGVSASSSSAAASSSASRGHASLRRIWRRASRTAAPAIGTLMPCRSTVRHRSRSQPSACAKAGPSSPASKASPTISTAARGSHSPTPDRHATQNRFALWQNSARPRQRRAPPPFPRVLGRTRRGP
mmetsp:Transcript_10049/g.23165  ORF Transcript_10049/g.23165 Transcript_10049/m.23165 type:complete len:305 (+) Transcript_10049:181-1095(+)